MSKLKDKPLKKCHTDKRKMIDDIHSEIIQEMGGDELNEYYLENGLILDKYYSEKLGKRDKSEYTSISDKGILSYFENGKKTEATEVTEAKEVHNIINCYMKNINDQILDEKYKDYDYNKCSKCNQNMFINEIIGELICESCGNTVNILVISEKNSYNDPPNEINYFSYKKIIWIINI